MRTILVIIGSVAVAAVVLSLVGGFFITMMGASLLDLAHKALGG